MCTIQKAKDLFLLAYLKKFLIRHTNPWHRHNGVESSQPRILALSADVPNGLPKSLQKPLIAHRIRIPNLHALRRSRLGDVLDGLFMPTVYRIKLDDHIALLPLDVPENSVETRRGILDDDDLVSVHVEELREFCAGLVKKTWVRVADEDVWSAFGVFLELAEDGFHLAGVCSEGS